LYVVKDQHERLSKLYISAKWRLKGKSLTVLERLMSLDEISIFLNCKKLINFINQMFSEQICEHF